MRVLVTGSRDWLDATRIHGALDMARRDAERRGEDMVIIHGDCPTGADAIADQWAQQEGVTAEPHPANWREHGRSAGPKRNQQMVERGAELCLAFIGDCSSPRCNRVDRHPSHGATHCAEAAEQAGIPVRRFLA